MSIKHAYFFLWLMTFSTSLSLSLSLCEHRNHNLTYHRIPKEFLFALEPPTSLFCTWFSFGCVDRLIERSVLGSYLFCITLYSRYHVSR